jgi:purine-binding chemotaxis protein CheW
MSESTLPPARALRVEFDRGFAQPLRAPDAPHESLLAVRVGGAACALRTGDIRALYADRSVTPVPTPLAELLGVAVLRGQIVPVYDLAALLGYRPAAMPERAPRWLALARTHAAALAFDAFDAQLAVTADRLVSAAAGAGAPRAHTHEAVRTDAAVLPIIALASVLDDVQRRSTAARNPLAPGAQPPRPQERPESGDNHLPRSHD